MYKLFLTEDQLRQLISLARPHMYDHLMILLGINTLFRVSDLISLRRDELIKYNGTIPVAVVVHMTKLTQKTKAVASIELREDTRTAIAMVEAFRRDTSPWMFPSKYQRGHHINMHTAERRLQKYFRLMGIENHLIYGNAFHALRRSTANILRDKSGSIETAMAALNHKRLSSTISYIDVAKHNNLASDIVRSLNLS